MLPIDDHIPLLQGAGYCRDRCSINAFININIIIIVIGVVIMVGVQVSVNIASIIKAIVAGQGMILLFVALLHIVTIIRIIRIIQQLILLEDAKIIAITFRLSLLLLGRRLRLNVSLAKNELNFWPNMNNLTILWILHPLG